MPSNARNVNGRRMSFQSLDELRRVLLELELVAPDQLAIAVDEVASVWRQPGPLLDLLERQGLLTTYQLSKLHKGETDGLVLGRYKLLYRNNSGSFARVFRACSLDDGKMVGLKVLRQRWASDPNYVKQFHREAEICQRLRHKNIVPIYDVGEDRGEHFLTMEFVEGGNLREFLKIRGQCSLIESAQCLLDMAEGLEYALSKGITHRDFKLTNVLMSTDRVAKLVDFGLASLNSTESGTDEGNLLALEYATLEKGTGAPDDDPRSDLFFLGGAVYELLTGSPPYPATKDRSERKQLSRYTNVRQLRSIAPHVPAALSEIVDNLMRVNPNERFQSATEVVHATRKAFKELGSIPREDNNNNNGPKTVLCIETRPRHQDLLRDYLTKIGFRVLMMTDLQRGMTRLRSGPTDAVLLMADSVSDDFSNGLQELVRWKKSSSTAMVVVLAQSQQGWKNMLEDAGSTRVLVQTIQLRDVRRELESLLGVKSE
ncbi:MAG: serine/threonine protein kinase [Planctomycetes bacterium]|nr:serine/threonine protein kinase [Planctomycetota bacterium]